MASFFVIFKTPVAASQSKPATTSASSQNIQKSQLCMSVILFNAKQAVLLLLRQGGQQTVKKSTIQPLMAKNLTRYSFL
jgi:hypothetical protein